MGRRSDKGRRVTRYLTGHTGIPLLRYDGLTNTIEAPAPYSISLITDAKWWRFGERVAATNDQPGIPFVIRYDGYIDDIDNAIVGCNLRAFTQLLTKHYEGSN